MQEFSINILNIAAVLLAAYLGGVLIKKIGYPAILGELLVGIILGPGMLGFLEYTESIKVLSEVGIILLMVYIGMEIDFMDLKKASWPGLLAAFGGFAVPFALGYFTVMYFGGTPLSALVVAIAIGVTSLATKSRILIDLKLLNTRIAYVLMAGALISDTLALIIFSGITNFAESNQINISELLLIGGKITAFFAITIGIGVFLLPKIGTFISKSKTNNSTLFFTLILIIVFGYCELAELAGMHSILGAFMAGLFIKENLFRKNISKELHKAFYDVSIGFMAPIFFVSAGFFVDVSVFKTDLDLLIIITLMAIVGKIVGTMLFYLPSKNGWREGLTIGTGMNGRGAVEIIIAEIGLEMGIIDKSIFSILVFMAIFTTLTVPVLLSWTSKWLKRRGELVYMDQHNGTLILGVNPLSLLVAKHMSKNSPVTLIDNNEERVELAKSLNFKCIHGNILNQDHINELIPNNIFTYIGLTPNSEVNLEGGLLLQKTLHTQNIFVSFSEKERKKYIKSLKKMDVKSVGYKTSQLETMVQKIKSKSASETKLDVDNDTTGRAWIEENNIDNKTKIPILIQDSNDTMRPFFKDDELKSGEKVVVINI